MRDSKPRNINEFRCPDPGSEVRLNSEEVFLSEYAELYSRVKEPCSKADLLKYSALEHSQLRQVVTPKECKAYGAIVDDALLAKFLLILFDVLTTI